MQMGCSHYGEQSGGSSKNETRNYHVIPLLGVCAEKNSFRRRPWCSLRQRLQQARRGGGLHVHQRGEGEDGVHVHNASLLNCEREEVTPFAATRVAQPVGRTNTA
ncbi:unnamed protein product [Rangifer tarandus platyrhynchus]|uniref:Uncharacterized protein n=1 Tax=Rangifer tarandus platyrhynchus TaxID=3082113 RepID=A0AC59ZUV8_RANTA